MMSSFTAGVGVLRTESESGYNRTVVSSGGSFPLASSSAFRRFSLASNNGWLIGVGSCASTGDTQLLPYASPVRDARANSGMSRQVGSKVNQSGQPVTATGVVGETPKLLSRHRKAP